MNSFEAQSQALSRSLDYLKSRFVGKDDIIDLMGICLVGRENLFLLGPPGTAKSALVRELAGLLHGRSFEYLLTRFTEPNEIFGPFDIRRLREGELVTNTEGMLPEADFVFLDELLNANSAILNSLLMALNERIFRRGRDRRELPALMIVGASNHLPEDEALAALFDRFLVRVRCDNVEPAQLSAVLDAGWRLEQKKQGDAPGIQLKDIVDLQNALGSVDLQAIRQTYLELIGQLRNAGVAVSDRRAVKLQRLIAASALLCGRQEAQVSDLWVMRYIWDTEEQREIITGIVQKAVESEKNQTQQHPRASATNVPSADDLFREVSNLATKWDSADTALSERAVLKDRLRHLSGRCAWLPNESQRTHVQSAIDALWKRVLEWRE